MASRCVNPSLDFDGFCPIFTCDSHGGGDSADSNICRGLSQDHRSLNRYCNVAKVAAVERNLEGNGDLLCEGAGLGVASDEDLTDGHATAAAALVYGSGRAVRLVPVGMDGGDFTILPEPAW